jgi:hypothetical protein
MQALGIIAVPSLFIKGKDPQSAGQKNNWTSDENFANEFLALWRNNSKMLWQSNMKLIKCKFESMLNLEILDALYYTMIDNLNPASFINREGNLIDSSTTGQIELMAHSSVVSRLKSVKYSRTLLSCISFTTYILNDTGLKSD